ncbi:MAG: SDR family oxidoreductase [Nocardioides sp.]|uniref:SDR family oxidoreductase n=1 Tax=Nocardioides sp. TaxID=35761 RepID=UPI003F09C237
MGTYVVTGSASGMGQAVVRRLRDQGHRVVGVDQRDADVVADLSTADGRRHAVEAVLELSSGVLDGAVMAAGVGPTPGKDRPLLIGRINVLGVVELLTAWRPALAASGHAKVVVFSSNSTTTTPLVPRPVVNAMLAGDVERAARILSFFGKAAPSFAYAASKIAVSHWVRRTAVQAEWAGAGIRLNAIAPGAIMTPMLEKQLATPAEARLIRRFPVPAGGFGDPDHLAAWAVFMLADTAEFLCGSVVFVDGGSDAWFRSRDWPRPYPLRGMGSYLQRFKGQAP